MPEDLDHLIETYLIDPGADHARLRDRLREDPVARRRFVRACRFEVAVAGAAAIAVPSSGRPAIHRGTPVLALAAVLVLSALLGLWWWWGAAPAAEDSPYRVRNGEVSVDGEADRPRDGAVIATVGDVPAELDLPDGSLVVLAPDCAAVLRRPSSPELRQEVEIRQGTASFRVAEAERGFAVTTAIAKVTVLGTEFSVKQRRNGRMTVQVRSGQVRVDHPKGSFLLVAGDRQTFDERGLRRRVRRGRLVATDREGDEPHLVIATGRKDRRHRYPLRTGSAERDGETVALADLPRGCHLEVRIGGRGNVVAITVLRPQWRAELVAVDHAAATLTLDPGPGGGPLATLPLAAGAIIRRGDRELDASDLLPGSRVEVRCDRDAATVESVEVLRLP